MYNVKFRVLWGISATKLILFTVVPTVFVNCEKFYRIIQYKLDQSEERDLHQPIRGL